MGGGSHERSRAAAVLRGVLRALWWGCLLSTLTLALLCPMSVVISLWLQAGPLYVEVTDHKVRLECQWPHGGKVSFTRTQLAWARLTRAEAWKAYRWEWPELKAAIASTPRGFAINGPPLPLSVIAAGGAMVCLVGRWALRESRRRAGRCVGCGYDLAGLREDRCPECGLACASRASKKAPA